MPIWTSAMILNPDTAKINGPIRESELCSLSVSQFWGSLHHSRSSAFIGGQKFPLPNSAVTSRSIGTFPVPSKACLRRTLRASQCTGRLWSEPDSSTFSTKEAPQCRFPTAKSPPTASTQPAPPAPARNGDRLLCPKTRQASHGFDNFSWTELSVPISNH
jgi:hypothetical protein